MKYYAANISYSSVCGRIRAYQVGSTNAFGQYYENQDTSRLTWMVLVSPAQRNLEILPLILRCFCEIVRFDGSVVRP